MGGSVHHTRKPLSNPLWISAGISVGILLLTHILQLLSQRDLYFINRIFLGYDLKYVWEAAFHMKEGGSPYAFEEYVWPPLLPWVLLKSGMMSWKFPPLAKGMLWLTLGTLLLSCHLANRLFADDGRKNTENVAPLLLLVFSSYPVYFLLDRGNLDGLTMALMWIGLWLGFRARSRAWHEVLGGAVLAVAIAVKMYPLVLLAPLLIFGRFRVLAGVVAGLALTVAVNPEDWRVFVAERLWVRVASADWSGLFQENASLEAFFLIVVQPLRNAGARIPDLLPTVLARLTAGLALVVALLSSFVLRREGDRRVHLAWVYTLIPIALATPSASLAYVLANSIPLIIGCRFLMGRYEAVKHARAALLLVFIGMGVAQMQAAALADLAGPARRLARLAQDPGNAGDIISASCSIGTFAVVLGLLAFQSLVAWSVLKGRTRPAVPANGLPPAATSSAPGSRAV